MKFQTFVCCFWLYKFCFVASSLQNCDVSPTIENGYVALQMQASETDHNGVTKISGQVIYRCIQGFLIGHEKAYCENGKWTNPPVCSATTPLPTTTVGVRSTDRVFRGNNGIETNSPFTFTNSKKTSTQAPSSTRTTTAAPVSGETTTTAATSKTTTPSTTTSTSTKSTTASAATTTTTVPVFTKSSVASTISSSSTVSTTTPEDDDAVLLALYEERRGPQCRYGLKAPHTMCLNDSLRLEFLERGPYSHIVNRHNFWRRNVEPQAVPPMGDLQWNDDLAVTAERLSAQCVGDHDLGPWRSLPARNNGTENNTEAWAWVGQNICIAEGYDEDVAWQQCIDGWASEKSNFMLGRGKIDEDGISIGHYTQMIWADTKFVGCGKSHCSGQHGGTDIIFVCNYYPGGNVGTAEYSGYAWPYRSQ